MPVFLQELLGGWLAKCLDVAKPLRVKYAYGKNWKEFSHKDAPANSNAVGFLRPGAADR